MHAAAGMRIQALLFVVAASGCAISDEDTRLGSTEGALSVWQWTDDVQIPSQSSQYQPGLAYYGGRLHMVHNGSSNPSELWWSRWNGSSWTTNVKLTHTATGGPALAVFDGELVMIYRAAGQNRLLMSRSRGTSWSSPVTAGTSLGSSQLRAEPAVAVHQGNLYAAYCKGIGVQIDRYDGASWTSAGFLAPPSALGCEHVEIASLPDSGRLHVVYSVGHLQPYPGTYLYEVTSATGTSWTAPAYMHQSSEKEISIVTCDGITHMVHGGNATPREIWWAFRDHGAWTEDVTVPNQASEGGSALGCFAGTRTLMVHNGGTHQLWQSEFGP